MVDDYEPSEQHEPTPDPAILEMMADNLDDRATTLQAEAKRAIDDGEELREMAEKLRD